MSRYITLGRSQQNKWIPLCFQPPILLHPMLAKHESFHDHNMVHENNKWNNLKENYGYFNYKERASRSNTAKDFRKRMRIKNL